MSNCQLRMLAAIFLLATLTSCIPTPPRSILLITIDTLRADRLSAYGYHLPTSPEMEKLAAGGTRFEYAFSTSASTAPSTASILTGKYPSFHSVGLLNGQYALDPDTPTLATALKAHGFRTCAIIGNPILRRELGLGAGFDHYDDDIEGHELNRINTPERNANRMVELATEWLDEADDSRFFLWLHFQDPHGPYTPPSEWEMFRDSDYSSRTRLPIGKDQSGYRAIPKYQVYFDERRASEYEKRYDSEIVYFDHHLGRLISALAERNLLSTTLVVLTADHGEAMGEDGFYFGHGHSVGLDQVRVPLILAGPGIPAGLEVATPVSNAAIMTSVLDVLDVEAPEAIVTPSLFGVLASQGDQLEPVYFETPNQSGVVFANMYLRHDRRPATDEAFWAAGNPNTIGFWKPLGEQVMAPLDPAGERLSRSFELRSKALLDDFDTWAAEARDRLDTSRIAVTLSPRQTEQLRALGYID